MIKGKTYYLTFSCFSSFLLRYIFFLLVIFDKINSLHDFTSLLVSHKTYPCGSNKGLGLRFREYYYCNRLLKKVEGYNGRNVVIIIAKMGLLVRIESHIMEQMYANENRSKSVRCGKVTKIVDTRDTVEHKRLIKTQV